MSRLTFCDLKWKIVHQLKIVSENELRRGCEADLVCKNLQMFYSF